jgi:hypothetical protein
LESLLATIGESFDGKGSMVAVPVAAGEGVGTVTFRRAFRSR